MRNTVARILTLCAIMLPSCGVAGPVKIEEAALPYVVEFVAEAARRNVGVSLRGLEVVFHDYPKTDDTAGSCAYLQRRVRLNRAYWEVAEINERRLLVYHELGHCLLLRAHTPDEVRAVMAPRLFVIRDNREWPALLDVLFKGLVGAGQ